jgi:hypothetical protein
MSIQGLTLIPLVLPKLVIKYTQFYDIVSHYNEVAKFSGRAIQVTCLVDAQHYHHPEAGFIADWVHEIVM